MVVDIWKDTDRIVEDLPDRAEIQLQIRRQHHVWLQQFLQLLHRSLCARPGAEPEAGGHHRGDPCGWWLTVWWKSCCLGQNVNSYGKNLEKPVTFAKLLEDRSMRFQGLERIRFMTSHPKDLSDDLIEAMRDCDKVCRHLHLPLQSGSSQILKGDEPPLYQGAVPGAGGDRSGRRCRTLP